MTAELKNAFNILNTNETANNYYSLTLLKYFGFLIPIYEMVNNLNNKNNKQYYAFMLDSTGLIVCISIINVNFYYQKLSKKKTLHLDKLCDRQCLSSELDSTINKKKSFCQVLKNRGIFLNMIFKGFYITLRGKHAQFID